MTTLADVALSCAKQLGRVNSAGTAITDLSSEIKGEIGEAIKFYNRKPWHITEWRGLELTTVAGQDWYSSFDMTSGDGDQDDTGRSSVDVNSLLDVRYLRGPEALYDELTRVPYAEFERLNEGGTSTGQGTYYTLYGGQMGIWPTPTAAYTLYFSGHVKPVVPTADSDESVWFDEAKELIECAALKRVCVKYLRDTDRATEFAAMEAGAETQFHSEHIRKTATGRLTPHG